MGFDPPSKMDSGRAHLNNTFASSGYMGRGAEGMAITRI
jgi:hypothetical protein